MAKAIRLKIKLVSSADTGHYYVTRKNSRTQTDKLVKKKYDPIAKKHVEYSAIQDQVSAERIARCFALFASPVLLAAARVCARDRRRKAQARAADQRQRPGQDERGAQRRRQRLEILFRQRRRGRNPDRRLQRRPAHAARGHLAGEAAAEIVQARHAERVASWPARTRSRR